MRKILAVWLLIFMSLGPTAFAADAVDSTGNTVQQANGGSSGNSKVNAETQRVQLVNIGVDPVNINHRTNFETHRLLVLVRPVTFSDIQSASGWVKNKTVPAGVVIDVPRGSTFQKVKDPKKRQEWEEVVLLTLPDEQAIITACGNVARGPKDHIFGKLIEERECPVCEPIVVDNDVCPNIPDHQNRVPSGMMMDDVGNCVQANLATAPIDLCVNIEGTQDRVPSGYQMNSDGTCVADFNPSVVRKRRVWPWIVGAGLLALAASTLGGGDDEECNNCPDRIPRPAP